MAAVSGTLIGWTIANVPIESLGAGGWLRSLAWAVVAFLGPLACTAALARGVSPPAFARMLGRAADRPRDPLTLVLGATLIATSVLALQAALMLVFDSRYVDFPFAPLFGAAFPFTVLALALPRVKGARPPAETLAAAVLASA